MKDTIFEDYILIKERIEFHCDKIIELLRLHSDLIFKTKKGDKLKYDIMNHSSACIEYMKEFISNVEKTMNENAKRIAEKIQ